MLLGVFFAVGVFQDCSHFMVLSHQSQLLFFGVRWSQGVSIRHLIDTTNTCPRLDFQPEADLSSTLLNMCCVVLHKGRFSSLNNLVRVRISFCFFAAFHFQLKGIVQPFFFFFLKKQCQLMEILVTFSKPHNHSGVSHRQIVYIQAKNMVLTSPIQKKLNFGVFRTLR